MNEGNCLLVPGESLAIDAQAEMGGTERISPGIGDPISVQIEGVVEGMENGQAKVRVQTINGQPVPAPMAQPSPDGATVPDEGAPTKDEELFLRSQARAWDEVNS